MHPRHRAALRLVRAAGIDVFVIPRVHELHGMAWAEPIADPEGAQMTRLFINMMGSIHSIYWLYVLLHEFSHHVLRHTTQYTSRPLYLTEYEADKMAIDLLGDLWPALVPAARKAHRDHIRRILQVRIDYGLWYNTDLRIARQVGCTIPQSFKDLVRGVLPPEGTELPAEEASGDGDLPF